MDSMPEFLAHNVLLPNGQPTIADKNMYMDQSPWFLGVKRTLNTTFGPDLNGISILDIGCGEGGYAAEFARLGMISKGVEIRRRNLERCEFLKESLDLDNLTYERGDANDLEKFGPVDVIFCCGLLYHLPNPISFINVAGKIARRMLFIHTHFSVAVESPATKRYKLSPICMNEGVPGRYFKEHDNPPEERLEKLRGLSWGNSSSFWVQKEYLLGAIQSAGFDFVFEQYDTFKGAIAKEMVSGYYTMHDRGAFVGIKTKY